MTNHPTLQAVKRTLFLTLLLFYLSGCTLLSGQGNVSTQASPATTAANTAVPKSQEAPLPATATIPLTTPQVGPGTSSSTPIPTAAATTSAASVTLGACQLDQVTQPPWPTQTLLPNELDPESGLHMTGSAQLIDLASYRLKVSGLVDHPLELTYDDLRCLPSVTDSPELICPGFFTDRATWTGVPIKLILDMAGIQADATQVTLVSADGYEVHIPLETALAEKNFLAYYVDGKPLPVLHGFPLRAVFPSMWGSYWLKWLVEIQIS